MEGQIFLFSSNMDRQNMRGRKREVEEPIEFSFYERGGGSGGDVEVTAASYYGCNLDYL